MSANASMPDAEIEPLRRFLLLAPLLTALPLTLRSTGADASQLNPKWTEITLLGQFDWKPRRPAALAGGAHRNCPLIIPPSAKPTTWRWPPPASS